MGHRGISRRDCLTLLGAGAAAAITPVVGHTSEDATPQTALRSQAVASKVATQSETEQLRELLAQRVFAVTPVQARAAYNSPESANCGQEIVLRDGWELLGANNSVIPGEYSSDSNWIKTEMPRPMQYALMQAAQVPNLWVGENYKTLQWIQQQDWYLRHRFIIPKTWRDSVIRLRFDGMDYLGLVWLDGDFLGGHEGAFGGPTFDITNRIVPGKDHELLVRLVHEPHDLVPNYDSSSENHNPRVVKPDAEDAESYQWGNRYRTIGLYQPIRLIATSQAYMEAPFVRTDAIGSGTARLWAQAMLSNTASVFDGVVETQIVDTSNQQVVWRGASKQKVPAGNSFWEREIVLTNPKLSRIETYARRQTIGFHHQQIRNPHARVEAQSVTRRQPPRYARRQNSRGRSVSVFVGRERPPVLCQGRLLAGQR